MVITGILYSVNNGVPTLDISNPAAVCAIPSVASIRGTGKFVFIATASVHLPALNSELTILIYRGNVATGTPLTNFATVDVVAAKDASVTLIDSDFLTTAADTMYTLAAVQNAAGGGAILNSAALVCFALG